MKKSIIFIVVFLLLFSKKAEASTLFGFSLTSPVANYAEESNEIVENQRKLQSLTNLKIFKVPILMYHYVEYVSDSKDTIRASLNTNPYIFEAQLKSLKEAKCSFLTSEEFAQVLDGTRQLPEKSVVITFDDGYRDFYTDAYPILKKYNIKATQYVISGFLNKSNYLTTEQLLEISNDNLVEIASHTVNHDYLKNDYAEHVFYEMEESKQFLENLLNKKINSFAYPYGAFDEQSINEAKKAGFTNAVSTIPGTLHSNNTRYFLFRIRPGAKTGDELLSHLGIK